MIKSWPIISSTAAGSYRVFNLRVDKKVSPRHGGEHDFIILECNPWVNVIATTPDDQVIMIEQFRHGSNTVELEIPGGIMEAGESPLAAGARELMEETGYAGEAPALLGEVFANPAIMTNKCYTVLVQNCRLQGPTEWDQGEDLITRLVPLADIPRLAATGKIKHSLVMVAFYHFDLWRRTRSAVAAGA